MKSKSPLLLVLAMLPFSAGAATTPPSYDLINLGTALGGPFAIGAGISNGGVFPKLRVSRCRTA